MQLFANCKARPGLKKQAFEKFFSIMRLTSILLLAASIQVSASGFSQKVSMNLKDANVKKVFKEIIRQSGISMIYKEAEIKKYGTISVDIKNASVEEALTASLKNLPLKFKVINNTVVVEKNPLPAPVIFSEASMEVLPPEKKITGKVVGENGEPLEGASVRAKGEPTAVTTAKDGNFSITVPDNAQILVVSYVGMETQEISISGKSTISVQLVPSKNDLNDIVVVGYGKTTKGKNITSVTTLNPEKITNLGATSVGDALAGRVQGLIVAGSGGGPGKRPTISIRGGGTPTYVIDDIISSEFQFQTLNINDIENISFLKDGPATAIYGVAAGNGLVLVTTKRGASNKLTVNYNYGYDLTQPTILPKKIGSYELVSLINKIDVLEGRTASYADAVVQKYKDQSDPLNFPDNDWQKLVLNDFAPQSHHNLALNGGNKQMQYYASIGYLDQGTLYRFKTNWLKRYNYRLSVTGNFEEIGLKTTVSIYGLSETRRDILNSYGSGFFNVWSHIQNRAPMDRAYADLEKTKYDSQGDHPLVEIDPRGGFSRNEDRDVNALLDTRWSVPHVKGLSFRVNANFRQSQFFGRGWNTTAPQYSVGSSTPATSSPPSLSVSSSTGYNYVLQGFAEYERKFGEHSVSGLLGYEEAYGFGENINAARNSYVFSIDQLFAGPQATATNGGSSGESVRNAWLGRLKYDYKDKYFFEGSFRYDGSDLFPDGNRKGFFPGAAVGWLITGEPFMYWLKEKKILDYLKARISYGEVGQNSGVGRFDYIPGYSLGGGYVVGGSLQPTLNPPGIPSPDISWFDQQSFNTGFDFATLNNRLSGSVDYFYLRTTGYLASPSNQGYTDPLGTGLPTRRSNGAFRRAGFDFSLKYTNSVGKLQYTIGSNFTRFDQLWELNPFEDSATLKNPYTTSYHQKGFLQTAYYALGLYQNSADIINNPRRRASNLAPGDIKYDDVNGDGKLDVEDFRRIGKATFPRVNYGFTADLKYGSWYLNMLWQGSGSRSIYLGDVIQSNYSTSIRYDFQTKDHWELGAGNTQFPRLISGAGINGSNNVVASDFWIINAGYLRLKALQIGYNFKNILAKNLRFISDLRVTLSGTNVLTFSKIKKYGLDPETGSSNNYDYPTQRVYALSVNLGF